MKRKLLFAMLCIVSALGMRAQTDVTSTYITNADFSKTDGWTTYASSQYHSEGNGLIGTYVVTNSYTSTTDDTHLATEYCFGVQCRWQTNYVAYQQTKESATLTAGVYTITYDVENTNTSTTSATYNNLFYVKVGETTYSDTSTEWMSGSSSWTTHSISFILEEETTADFMISLGYGTGSNNYASGNTPHVYISHLAVNYTALTVPTALSLSSSELALNPTATATLTATYTPADANYKTDITWTTSDASVATVADGVVTAIGAGTATITATTANSVSATCVVTVTDVTPVDAPAFYSEVAAGDFYIVNAATGKYLGGANSWGTQASLIEHGIPFTVAIGDGVYTLDSHTYNSATAHFFNGTYVDQASTDLYITSLGSGKYSISTADGSAFVTANVNDNVVANTAPTANSVLAQWYFVSKANRDQLLTSATSAVPVDATYYIKEANYSRNLRVSYGVSGWTGDKTYGQDTEAGRPNYCAERYHVTTDVYQTIENIPNGRYVAKVQGFSDEATFYANDAEVALMTNAAGGYTPAPNSMATAGQAFTAGYYVNEVTVYVTDNTLKLGIKSTNTGIWTIWDNFELYYYGPTVGGEATEIPMATETAMTAGSWYYFDIPVDGLYNLTTTTLSDIVYTNDATVLIENESSVTATFSQAENETLTAGRYYVKSTTAQSLKVSVGAYAYNVGAATLSTADGGYTQSSTFTVTFPAAATSDPDGAAALVASSTATVNGNTVALTAVENGFSLDLGTLTESSDYVIAIPAGVYGYAGESVNEAISVTLHTPVVFDGEYVLYDATNELFLGRGAAYGTEATADKYGIPFNLVTDATGVSSVEFVDVAGVYLFKAANGIYTDNASTGWKFVETTGGYYLRDADLTYYLTHAAGGYGEYVTTTTSDAAATVWTLKTLAERDAIIAEYSTENINNVITASGVATTADAFATYLSTNYNAEDLTSVVGTASFAGAVGDWTWTGYGRNQDGQPAYGTGFVEAWNATGAWTQTIDKANLPAGIYKVTIQGYERRKDNDAATALKTAGYNLVSTFLSANGEQVRFTDWNDVAGKPTNTGGAVTAFTNGEATNEVYVYLDGNTDLSLMIRKPNYIWDCWIIWNNVTLTRYEQSEATMKISDAQYATFIAPFDVTIPDGVTAYTVDGVEANGSTLTMTEVTTTIAANTPVVLFSENTVNETFAGKAIDADDLTEGLLTGVYTDTQATAGTYVLQNNDSKVGFYLVAKGKEPTVGANRAYLTATAADGVKAAFFFDSETAIKNVFSGMESGEIYDIAGRKVSRMNKGGIYVVAGHKVAVN